MSALKALNFVAVPKQAANDPVQARRNKLITQLEQQRELAKDDNYVVKRQKWVKQEDGGKPISLLASSLPARPSCSRTSCSIAIGIYCGSTPSGWLCLLSPAPAMRWRMGLDRPFRWLWG